jgi:hypothetical protein
MKNKYLLYPFYTFLLIFFIDKLFYIPIIQKYFVKNNFSFYENIFTVENLVTEDFYKKYEKNYSNKDDLLKNSLVFLGTSRSEIFKTYTPLDISKNPFLENPEKIINKPVVSHIIKAGTIFHLYQLYKNTTKKYNNLPVYAMELNFGSINKNSFFRRKNDIENLDINQFIEIYSDLSFQNKVDYFSSRLFILNTKNISFIPIKKNSNFTEELSSLFQIYKKVLQSKTDPNSGFKFIGTQEGLEVEVRNDYDIFIKDHMETIFLKFEESPYEINLINKIISDAKQNKYKLILYKPKLHKDLISKIDEKYKSREEIWLESIKQNLNNNIIYFDLNEPNQIKCNYFTDPSHISLTCAPEIIEKFSKFY